jgi:hypothetical protein
MEGLIAFIIVKLLDPVAMALCLFIIFSNRFGSLRNRVLISVAAAAFISAAILSAVSPSQHFGQKFPASLLGACFQTAAALLVFQVFGKLKEKISAAGSGPDGSTVAAPITSPAPQPQTAPQPQSQAARQSQTARQSPWSTPPNLEPEAEGQVAGEDK